MEMVDGGLGVFSVKSCYENSYLGRNRLQIPRVPRKVCVLTLLAVSGVIFMAEKLVPVAVSCVKKLEKS